MQRLRNGCEPLDVGLNVDVHDDKGDAEMNKKQIAAFIAAASLSLSAFAGTTAVKPKITMEQVCVASKSELTRQSLGQLSELRKSGVIVLAIRTQRGETIFNPPDEVEISAGDFLIVMGERSSLQKLEQILIS